MKQSNPISPTTEQELERWQQRSESKLPPNTPRQLLYELPRLTPQNEAAASPTVEEDPPGDRADSDEYPVDLEAPEKKSVSTDPEKGVVADTILERFEGEGGTTEEATDSGKHA